MSEEENQPPTTDHHESEGSTLLNFFVLFVMPFTLSICLVTFLYTSFQGQEIHLDYDQKPPPPAPVKQLRKPVRAIISQPNCTIEAHIEEILAEILQELHLANLDKITCKPEDFHTSHQVNSSVSNHNSSEPRAHFVIYLAVALLLTSLMAALVDVYKVKGKPSKVKPQLTKRCSLADLTVLRHSRRESMKKDSMVEEQRNPQKSQGASVLYRRSSEPLYHGEMYSNTNLSQYSKYRKVSLDIQHEIHANEPHHGHGVRVLRRF